MSIDQVITERWSHSEEIDAAAESIYEKIRQTIRGAQEHEIIKHELYLRTGETSMTLFGRKITLNYYVYIAYGEESLTLAINSGASLNGISDDETAMYVTVYTLRGEVIEKISNRNVYHEAEHMLQISMGQKNNPSYRSLVKNCYRRVKDVLGNQDEHTQTEVNIAWLYYYSDPHEQDAMMNEYYSDLAIMRQVIGTQKTPTQEVLDNYQRLAQWFERHQNTADVSKEAETYRRLGMQSDSFLLMVRKGLRRFEKKMRNVEKHFASAVRESKAGRWRGGVTTYKGSLIRLPV